MKLLFVCSNNFIRSPFAEQRLRIEIAGDLSQPVEIASAGAFAGLLPRELSKRAIDEALVHGVDLSMHRTRSTSPELLNGADLILPMDEDSHWFVTEELRAHPDRDRRIRRFVSFISDLSLREIADPLIDGNSYDETYPLIVRGVIEIRRWLRTQR